MIFVGLENNGEILPGATHYRHAVAISSAEALGNSVLSAYQQEKFLFTNPELNGLSLPRIGITTIESLYMSSLARQIGKNKQLIQEEIGQEIPDNAHLMVYEPGAVLPTHTDIDGTNSRVQIFQLLGRSSYSVYDKLSGDRLHTIEPIMPGDMLDTDGHFPHSAKNIGKTPRVALTFLKK